MAVRRGYVVLFLIFVTLGIYYPSIFSEISPVDDIQIITSYLNTDRFDIKALFIPSDAGYYYRPLLGLTLIFDKIVWGMHESFMHLENILIHALNVILVFLITEKVAKRYSIANSFLPPVAALLFAVHPINTESVNWIAGRTDLLAGFFLLLSMLLLIYSLERDSQLMGVAGVSVFFLACMSKEVAVSALPGLLAIVLFYDHHGSFIERLRRRWACSGSLFFVVIAFFLLLVRFLLFNRGDNGIKLLSTTFNPSGFDFLNDVRLSLTALGFYAKKLFLPWPLNFAIVHVSGYYILAGLTVLLIIVYILIRRGLLSALALTCICLVLPALLVSVARMTWTPVAERYLYISCAIFCIVISVIVQRIDWREGSVAYKMLPFFIITILTLLTYSTVNRNIVWQNNITLLRDTLRNSPDFYLAQNALVISLKEKGRFEESRALMMSIKAPDGSKRGGKLIDSNQAMILAAQGNLPEAKKLLLRNIENSGVMYPRILENLVTVNMQLLGQEKNKNTVLELREEIVGYLLKLHEKSGDPFYYYRIGQFYLGTGNKPEAQSYFAKAALFSPDGAYYKKAATKLAEKLKQ